jgi:hypothetical protein
VKRRVDEWKKWVKHRAQNEVVVNGKAKGNVNEALGEGRGQWFFSCFGYVFEAFFVSCS